ncbi:hypothetical protein C8R45DRAFT_568441 [Mycena sanguinolenta]|nr:hypothetical protein C8R45DRAFT_568441 [Mycena sanguinolenta]
MVRLCFSAALRTDGHVHLGSKWVSTHAVAQFVNAISTEFDAYRATKTRTLRFVARVLTPDHLGRFTEQFRSEVAWRVFAHWLGVRTLHEQRSDASFAAFAHILSRASESHLGMPIDCTDTGSGEGLPTGSSRSSVAMHLCDQESSSRRPTVHHRVGFQGQDPVQNPISGQLVPSVSRPVWRASIHPTSVYAREKSLIYHVSG